MELRDYQVNCFNAALKELDTNIRKTAVIMPTSSGKTQLAFALKASAIYQ